MNDEPSSEDHEVKRTTEARQGQVSRGAPVWWVLVISTGLTALAFLIIYLVFVA